MNLSTSVYLTEVSVYQNATVPTENSTVTRNVEPSNDALFYIFTVLMFYACSIVILMVKYIRKAKMDAEFSNYYYEFVSREKFRNPRFQNAVDVDRMVKSLRGKYKVVPGEEPKITSFSETSV